MNVLIDADGCPVVDLTLQIAKQFGIPVIILCDTSHQIEREGAQTLVFDKGADSVDFALVNRVKPGDIVVTQDYGLARQHGCPHAAAVRKQKAPSCRQAPERECKADEGAGHEVFRNTEKDFELQTLIDFHTYHRGWSFLEDFRCISLYSAPVLATFYPI